MVCLYSEFYGLGFRQNTFFSMCEQKRFKIKELINYIDKPLIRVKFFKLPTDLFSNF